MKAVSIRMEGISGALSTAKPACSTEPLCRRLMPPISRSTALPSFMLSLICAVVDRSSSTLASCLSWFFTFTPPIRSAWFSLLASQRAAVEVAPFSDSTKTDEPRAVGWMKASAWIETNRSACTLRAFSTRMPSGTKKSASRVSMTRMLGCSSSLVFRRLAMASTTSFSRLPRLPMAPGSSPPWPGSSAMVIMRTTFWPGRGRASGRCSGRISGAGGTMLATGGAMATGGLPLSGRGSAGGGVCVSDIKGLAGSLDQSPFSIICAIRSGSRTGYRSKIKRWL